MTYTHNKETIYMTCSHTSGGGELISFTLFLLLYHTLIIVMCIVYFRRVKAPSVLGDFHSIAI